MKVGLPVKEIEELKSRYLRLLGEDEVRTSITGYIEKQYFKIFETIVCFYGRIIEICVIKLHEVDFIVFRIKLNRQKLLLSKKLFLRYMLKD
ncbi:hypothetical protein D5274_17790 [bacterium 1XD42-94]|nr:hypothetical protein [bacterium 1XD42-94]